MLVVLRAFLVTDVVGIGVVGGEVGCLFVFGEGEDEDESEDGLKWVYRDLWGVVV